MVLDYDVLRLKLIRCSKIRFDQFNHLSSSMKNIRSNHIDTLGTKKILCGRCSDKTFTTARSKSTALVTSLKLH